MSAILEFYFRFRLYYYYQHVILHQRARYHLYRTTYCGNIMSYRFFKMAAAAVQYYFRFRICWCHCLQKVKIYHQTKFHWNISIHGWDITTSGLEKQTSAILEFYFQFQSRPFPVICMSFYIRLLNFVHIRAPAAKIWRHIHFSKLPLRLLNTTFGFVFVHVTAFRRSKSISKPNIVHISQFASEI